MGDWFWEIKNIEIGNNKTTDGVKIFLDKAPRLSISIVVWILSSDTETSATTPICQLNQFNTNSEAAMLSTYGLF